MTTSEAQDILNTMTRSIREGKDKAGAGLTPVGAERRPEPVPTPEAPFVAQRDLPFPYDGPEFILPAIQRMLNEWQFVQTGLLAMQAAYGGTPAAVDAAASEAMVTKAKERAADARIKSMMVELAPGFPPVPPLRADLREHLVSMEGGITEMNGERPVGEDGEDAEVIDWECPDHDARAVRKTSPQGREYIGCSVAGCKKFSRP
jgi:hypothetical protein